MVKNSHLTQDKLNLLAECYAIMLNLSNSA